MMSLRLRMGATCLLADGIVTHFLNVTLLLARGQLSEELPEKLARGQTQTNTKSRRKFMGHVRLLDLNGFLDFSWYENFSSILSLLFVLRNVVKNNPKSIYQTPGMSRYFTVSE
jgi:hypothetical protein